MIYSDGAPKELIDQLERTKKFHQKYPNTDLESIVLDVRKKYPEMPESAFENLRASLYRNPVIGLPHIEEENLLDKLLSDLRMKTVWAALKRREKTDRDLLHFWKLCCHAIAAWRGEQKLTTKQRQEFFQQIFDHAAALQSLMNKTKEFHHYSIASLIEEASVEWFVETLDISTFNGDKNNVEYARFCLSDVVPSLDDVFSDIAAKAKEYGQKEPIVLKPASENAPIHFFVRTLSTYFRKYYGQPLHDAVAITTAVVFDHPDIDTDLVRKLVSS